MKPLLAKKHLFALLAGLLALVLLFSTLPSLGRTVLAQVSGRLGMEIEIGEIGGNIFNHLTVATIKGVRTDKTQPVSGFAAADVRLDYSLASLFGGADAFLARLRIEASRAKVVLDLAGGQDSRPAAENGGGVGLPAVLPALAVGGIELAVHAADYDLAIADTSLRVEPAAGRSGQPVQLHMPVLRLRVDGREKLATSCRLKLLYGAGQIRIEEMSMADKIVSLQGVLVRDQAGRPASFTLQAEVSGGRLQGSGTFAAAGQTNLGLQLTNIDIAELARLLHWEDFAGAGRLSGSISWQFAAGQRGSQSADISLGLAQGRLFGEKTEASFQGGINHDKVIVKEFAATHGQNRVAMTGGTAPLTVFTDWDPARLAGLESKSIKLQLRNIPAFMAAFGLAAPLRAFPDHLLEARGGMADRVLTIDQADLKTGSNSAWLTAARLRFTPAGQSMLDSPVAGALQLDISDLRELASLFALPVMAGQLRGDAVISGTLRSPAGAITLAGERLAYGNSALGEVKVEARADSRQLRIASLRLGNGADTLEAAGRYSFQTGRSEDITGRVLVEDVGRYAGLWAMEGKASGRLEAALTTTEAGELRLDMTMGGAAFAGLHDAALRGVMTTDWRSCRITDAEVKTGQGSLRFSVHITPQPADNLVRAELGALTVAGQGDEFTLERPAQLVLSYGEKGTSLELGEMLLRSAAGDISLRGSLAMQAESWLQVQAQRLTGRGWLDGLTGGGYQFSGADVLFILQGPLAVPRASLAARIAEINCPQLTVPLSGDIAVDYDGAAGLTIRRFLLTTDQGQQISLAGLLPYDPLADNPFLPAALDLKGKAVLPGLRGIADNTAVNAVQEGQFSGDLQLTGSWEQPAGALHFTGSNLYLHRFLNNAPREPLTVAGHIAILPGALQLRQLTVQGSPLSFSMDGTWSDIPTLAGLIRQPPEGLPGTVAFDGRLEMTEVGWLAAYAGGLRRLTGHLAATMSARGPAARPLFSGATTLTGGGVRLENANLPAIEQLELQAGLDQNVVNLHRLSGVFGGAPFQASGSVALTGPDAPVVDCRLQGRNLLFYRDASMKIRADADLTVKGPWRRLELGGKVVIVDGRYMKNVDFLTMFRGSARPKSDLGMQLFSLTETPWRDMAFDVLITSDTPLTIYNNMARGGVRPNLHLTGTGEIPVLAGRIFVDQTRISVPAGKIVIESGVVSFPENDPDRPTFDLSGKSRLAGYDITLIFQGTSDEPVITLASDPPLAEDELLLLVLTGSPPQLSQEKEKEKRAMANMNTAVYLGRGLLSRWFGGESIESEESMLDRFEFDFGRQLSKSGEETVEAQFRLIEGLFLPGDRLFLTSEKDIYDNFNVGVKVVFRFK
jgi:autotransporter translocation and assembly factor TamB